ncbi:peptidase [Ruegeria arenilitoris]|uniref:peptidase n=1 Tax=Ruegeria arenilitoris TaxID=1173585 RepID=UPI0014814716|nr:peptidase [Ruegeria arenilitoris]
MPRATTTIPFHALRFEDDLPTLHEVERRLKTFLRGLRRQRQAAQTGDDEDGRDKMDQFFDYLNEAERRKIRRRAHRYVQRLDALSGLSHHSEENRAKLTPLRGGLPVTRITTEHEADEIAAALHAEMPWMAPASEAVWHGLRASAREGLPGVRFTPLVLIGPPGIGKSFWARRLAHHLEVPATKIDATGEPASFALTGSQRGWGSAHAGKLVNTVLNSRQGLPEPFQSRCVVLDLPDLTTGQLRDFAMTEAARRNLPAPAVDALAAIFETGAVRQSRPSLRSVARMLDRAETLAMRPLLH